MEGWTPQAVVTLVSVLSTFFVALAGFGVQLLVHHRQRREARREARYAELMEIYGDIGRAMSRSVSRLYSHLNDSSTHLSAYTDDIGLDARHYQLRLHMHGATQRVIDAFFRWRAEFDAPAPLPDIVELLDDRLQDFYEACDVHLAEVWPRDGSTRRRRRTASGPTQRDLAAPIRRRLSRGRPSEPG